MLNLNSFGRKSRKFSNSELILYENEIQEGPEEDFGEKKFSYVDMYIMYIKPDSIARKLKNIHFFFYLFSSALCFAFLEDLKRWGQFSYIFDLPGTATASNFFIDNQSFPAWLTAAETLRYFFHFFPPQIQIFRRSKKK